MDITAKSLDTGSTNMKAATMMATGWKLRQLMADRKITNDELAEGITKLTGRSRHSVTISRWRQEDIMPKIDGIDLDAICTFLNCTRDELLGDA